MKLFEIITGIEIYKFPDMFGHIKVSVFLEPIEDILIKDVPYSKQEDSIAYFNTSGFVQAMATGYLPAIECFFVDKDAIVFDNGLEYEELRLNRSSFVTKEYFNRAIAEFEEVFKYSKGVITVSPKDKDEYKKQWKECIKAKIYCIYQLDCIIKILKDKNIPGEPFDISNFYDIDVCDINIERMKEEALKLSEDLPEKFDYIYAIKVLRVVHFNKIKLINNE